MESGSNLLAHSSLPFYQNGLSSTTVSSLLSSSPSTQDTLSRTALSTQNGWPSNYTGETGNSCSMASYGNLQLGASFPMNGKSPYNSFSSASADYLNCRQMNPLNPMNHLNAMPAMRNYSLYGDMYQAAHPPGYTNGGFYPDMTHGIPPLPGRDIDCRSSVSDSPNQESKGRKKRKPYTRYQSMVLENEF